MQIYEDSLKFWARAGDLHGGRGLDNSELWLSAEVATLHDELPMCLKTASLALPRALAVRNAQPRDGGIVRAAVTFYLWGPLVYGLGSLGHERMTEHHLRQDDAATAAVAELHGLATTRREVDATAVEAALSQALVDPLLRDLSDASD